MAACIGAEARVEDEDFLRAWGDREVQGMLASKCRPFAPYVERREYDAIQRQAVFLSLRAHRPELGRKLVNMLANKVRWMMSDHQRAEYRKRRLRRRLLETATFGDVAADDAGCESVDDRDFVDRLLGELDDREADVVRRKFYGGESLRDIGRTLGVSPEKASDVFHAAMAKMKKYADRAVRPVGS